MNNYSIFNKQPIIERLDLFAPGMAQHITPIKYEVMYYLSEMAGQHSLRIIEPEPTAEQA